jgi:hypothetical protein
MQKEAKLRHAPSPCMNASSVAWLHVILPQVQSHQALSLAAEFASGALFAMGLAYSGMVRPTKVSCCMSCCVFAVQLRYTYSGKKFGCCFTACQLLACRGRTLFYVHITCWQHVNYAHIAHMLVFAALYVLYSCYMLRNTMRRVIYRSLPS